MSALPLLTAAIGRFHCLQWVVTERSTNVADGPIPLSDGTEMADL
jgi:hypothetical protein